MKESALKSALSWVRKNMSICEKGESRRTQYVLFWHSQLNQQKVSKYHLHRPIDEAHEKNVVKGWKYFDLFGIRTDHSNRVFVYCGSSEGGKKHHRHYGEFIILFFKLLHMFEAYA